MNLRWAGQATLNSLRNFAQKNMGDQTDKRFSEAVTNETKLTHTYLPTYLPNKTAANETGGEREKSP